MRMHHQARRILLASALTLPAPGAGGPAQAQGLNPLEHGRLVPTTEVLRTFESLVDQRIEHDPATNSYPAYFREFIRHHLGDGYGQVLLIETSEIPGPLLLDWSTPWIKEHRVTAVAAMDDLRIDGSVRNGTAESGPMLFVGGNLRVHHLFKGGSPVIVLGDLLASGWVIGEYNDGVMRVGGDLKADLYGLLDHDGFVRGSVRSRLTRDPFEVEWSRLLRPEFLEEPEDPNAWPQTLLLWKALMTGREVLRE